jgi:hypothetical protein
MDEVVKPAAESPFANAFSAEYREWLLERSEPFLSGESEGAGPWELRQKDSSFCLFRLWEGFEHGDVPEAAFQTREAALIFFAVRPAVGRDPLYRSLEPARKQGFAVESAGQVAGHLRFFNPAWLQAAHVGACLARSPMALAALLVAGGPELQEQVGRILGRNLLGSSEP